MTATQDSARIEKIGEIMIRVCPVRPGDAAVWLEMRRGLWPDEDPALHAAEIERFFAGELREPLAVLIAIDEHEVAVGFAELSIRAYAEDCLADNVGYLE